MDPEVLAPDLPDPSRNLPRTMYLGLGIITVLYVLISLGTAVALAIFLVVSVAACKLRRETGSKTSILVAAIVLTVVVFAAFAVQTLRNESEMFTTIIGILVLAVGLDLVWARRRSHRAAADPLSRIDFSPV